MLKAQLWQTSDLSTIGINELRIRLADTAHATIAVLNPRQLGLFEKHIFSSCLVGCKGKNCQEYG